MTLLTASIVALLVGVPRENPPVVVHAPDSPVKIGRVRLLNVVPNEPAVLLYEATNTTDYDLEHFTVRVFFFDAEGTLKARQIAPARHMLEKKTTKFSAMVLDGYAVTATDRVVLGVDQAQRLGSEKWWHGELEALAKDAIKSK